MWFLAEFAWDSYGLPLSINAHAPRYPHQCLQLNDSLPSAGQGGHISSGTKQQTLQPPGSYPFLPLGRVSKIILPFEIHPLNHWTMKNGRKSNPSKWVQASQTADLFFVVLKNAPQRFCCRNMSSWADKNCLPRRWWSQCQGLEDCQGDGGKGSGYGLYGWRCTCRVRSCMHRAYLGLIGLMKREKNTHFLSKRLESWSREVPNFPLEFPTSAAPPSFLCFLLAIDITCSENCQGLLYSPPIFGGDQVGRHHTQAACQRVFFVVFPWIHGSIRKDYLHLFLLFHGLHFGTGPQSCHFFGSPKKQLGKSPS